MQRKFDNLIKAFVAKMVTGKTETDKQAREALEKVISGKDKGAIQ